jgi:hypothetical protein
MVKSLSKDIKAMKVSQVKVKRERKDLSISLMDELSGLEGPATTTNELLEFDDRCSPHRSSFISFTPNFKSAANGIFNFPRSLVKSHVIEIYNLLPESYTEKSGETIGEMSLDVSNKKDPIKEYFILVT